MKYNQSHKEKVTTSSEVPLYHDASKLNMSLSGNAQIPVKNLNLYESQLRDLLKVLPHADIFSYAAYMFLHQESIDCKMLARILEALATSINHSVSLASYGRNSPSRKGYCHQICINVFVRDSQEQTPINTFQF